MNKRITSIVLLVTMLMSFLVPGVYAAEDDNIYIDNVVVTDSETENEDLEPVVTVESTTEPQETDEVFVEETTAPAEDPTEPLVEDVNGEQIPACDCGASSTLIAVHSDVCAMKQFCMELCDGGAAAIHAQWDLHSENVQAFVMTYLGYQNPDELKELMFLLASQWESGAGLSGVASAIKDGTIFGAFGIPEDAALQIQEAAAEAKAAIEAFVAQQENTGDELFTWDISVLDGEGAFWQPDGSVRVELELPGVELHKNTQLYVVHVDDEGNAEKIEAELIDGNKIAFNTNGFSTFAAYTVDFEYNGVPFSIPGGSEIMLSDLMDQLGMDFGVEEVSTVEFTNYDLIAIEKQDSDWKLTSLQAFQTEEKLTLTLTDGRVYEIKVTDDPTNPAKIYVGGAQKDSGGNGIVTWNLYWKDQDSNNYTLADHDYTGCSGKENDGWSAYYDIVISGGGQFQIDLQGCKDGTVDTYYLYLQKLIIRDGTQVTIRLGACFDPGETIIIRGTDANKAIFDVEDGGLFIRVSDDATLLPSGTTSSKFGDENSTDYVTMVIDGKNLNTSTSSPMPIIHMQRGVDEANRQNLVVEDVIFRNAKQRAVLVQTNNLTRLQMTNCKFESTVYSSYAGGAICVTDTTNTSTANAVDVPNLKLKNCVFDGNKCTSQQGGAVAIFGNLNNTLFEGCQFLNCTSSASRAGALEICVGTKNDTVNMGDIEIKNCTFTGNTASSHGGAIDISKGDATLLVSDITISGCTFSTNTATVNRGGAIRTLVQADSFTISDCTFSGNKANNYGGDVSFQGSIGTIAVTGSSFANSSALHGGAIAVDCPTTTPHETYGSSLTVSGCSFNKCISGGLEPICYKDDSGNFLDANGNQVAASNKHWSALSAEDLAKTQKVDKNGNPVWNGYGSGGAILIRQKHNSISIKGTSASAKSEFQYCKTLNSGGAICFDDNVEVSGTVTMQYLNIHHCEARDAGNAIYFGSCTIPSATLSDSDIKYNTYVKDYVKDSSNIYEKSIMPVGTTMGNGSTVPEHNNDYSKMVFLTNDSGGTIRCIGESRVVLGISDCEFWSNESFSNGGAVYWNANRKTKKSGENAANNTITPALTIDGGNFKDNIALRDGGAVYCEASITITGGNYRRNIAQRGGAIAQQVYNNSGRQLNAGEKTLLKLSDTTYMHKNYARQCGGAISILANETSSIADGTNLAYPISFQLNGAKIYDNVAAQNGGGIYFYQPSYDNEAKQAEVDAYVKTITIDNGQIYNNIAGYGKGTESAANLTALMKTTISADNATGSGSGGGIFMEAGEPSALEKPDVCSTTLNVTGGSIYKNTAHSGNGGAIYLEGKYALCTVTGGTIGGSTENKNTAVNGGGIAIAGGAEIQMKLATGKTTGGTISYNEATKYGGGVWLDWGITFEKEVTSGSTTETVSVLAGNNISIAEGHVQYNTAGISGGGIYALGGANVSVEGGSIDHNSASSGGGIFVMGNLNFDEENNVIYETFVTVAGGEISYNKATGDGIYDGQGGGIHVDRFVDVSVKESDDGSTVGKITHNTASKGGGVYVVYGAKLSVHNGFITYNNANVPENITHSNTTTWHDNHGLHGVGGGVYVADGYEDVNGNYPDVNATFTLTGDNIAIYGNLAGFAADDVFSSGLRTKLSVPQVKGMNLKDYKGNADSWYEDYAIADTKYESGTEYYLNTNKFVNGDTNGTTDDDENVRYRNSANSKKVAIPDSKVASAVNVANAFVCMTLGVPAAVDDVIVMDYSVNVKIYPHKNDLIIGNGSSTIKGVANYFADKNNANYEKTLPSGFHTSSSPKSDGICGTMKNYGSYIDYALDSMVFDKEVVLTYGVEFEGYIYYADIYIIPATTIYYEDDNAAITYRSHVNNGTTTTTTTGIDTWEKLSATKEPNDTDKYYQDTDLPGTDVNNALGNLDMDSVYGFDNGYTNSQDYSWYTSRRFTASLNNGVLTYGTVEFNFKGTGFDITSLTSRHTGTITVQVYQKSALSGVTARPIPSSVSTVKQLVVDTYYGYKYTDGQWLIDTENSDTLYQVPVVKVNGLTYGEYTAVITISYADFFDHNHDGSYDFYLDAIRIYDPANDGTNSEVVQDAYVADNEGWPEYLELRNLLISRKDFDSQDESSGGVASGILFIDGKGNIDGYVKGSAAVSDYTNYGPNNEVYLRYGQSLAFNFALSAEETAKVASVQIGLKSVGGTANVRCYGLLGGATTYALGTTASTSKSISTAADMYYDITALLGKDIVIMNAGSSSDAILSITNIKVTYKTAHTDGLESNYFTSSRTVATNAIESIEQYYAEAVVPAELNVIGASLSFEDEILTNLYYTTSNMEGVAASDMGLLTWSAMPENGTIDDAENIFEGAAYDDVNARYMVHTDGIAAKKLGDDIYMRVYAKISDGSYVYSDVITYSPKQYAMSRLEKSDNDSLKALCVAMLNYGAAAQNYFGYRIAELANSDLTADQQALVTAYSAGLFAGAIAADPAKVGTFTATKTGFSAKSASVSFESAFAINYYLTPDAAVDGDVTFYYWNADAYEGAEILTADNASGEVAMTVNGNGIYWAAVSGIAVKQLDDTYYVAAVYTSNGETYCSGVITYSLSKYCMNNANNNMGDLAQATAMYGYYAKNYFG